MPAPTYLLCSVPFIEHTHDAHYLVRTEPPRFIARLVEMADEHTDCIPFSDFTGMIIDQWMDQEPPLDVLLKMLPDIEEAVQRYVDHGVAEAIRQHREQNPPT